jgi:hypothetical protein
MDRDLYKALRGDEYPEIRYELADVEVLTPQADSTDVHELRATGLLTVAGTTRLIETALHGFILPDGGLRATGEQSLMMTDFGIKRPSALGGLIKARNKFVVRFELIAAPEAARSVGGR